MLVDVWLISSGVFFFLASMALFLDVQFYGVEDEVALFRVHPCSLLQYSLGDYSRLPAF